MRFRSQGHQQGKLLSYILSSLLSTKHFWVFCLLNSDRLEVCSPSLSSAGNSSPLLKEESIQSRGRAVIERWQEITPPSLMAAMLCSLCPLGRWLGVGWGWVSELFQEVGSIPLSQKYAKCLMNSTGQKVVMWLWKRGISSYWTIHNPFVSGKSLKTDFPGCLPAPTAFHLHTQPWGWKLIYFYLISLSFYTTVNQLLWSHCHFSQACRERILSGPWCPSLIQSISECRISETYCSLWLALVV